MINKVKPDSNMYQGWVDYTHSHLAGKCSHECSYCYVQSMAKRFPAIKERYSGEIRLIEKEFKVNYDKPGTYFIEHMNDLFAYDVPYRFIERILSHCKTWPDNTYVFQTKNPDKLGRFSWRLPKKNLVGITLETNRITIAYSKASLPYDRIADFMNVNLSILDKFITIEPIMQFDLDIFSEWITEINPKFINIGADSKNSGLPEPTWEEVQALIDKLRDNGIEVRQKSNLERLKGAYKNERASI